MEANSLKSVALLLAAGVVAGLVMAMASTYIARAESAVRGA